MTSSALITQLTFTQMYDLDLGDLSLWSVCMHARFSPFSLLT